MKYFIYLSLLLGLLTGSCTGEKVTQAQKELERLRKENGELKEQASGADSVLLNALSALEDIQSNVDLIRKKENKIRITSEDPELAKQADKDQVIADIREIYDMMLKNRKRASWLSRRLSDSTQALGEMRGVIKRLVDRVAEQDLQIDALELEMLGLNEAYDSLMLAYDEKSAQAAEVAEELEGTVNELNEVFFIVGGSADLIEKGVLTKEGGFIGLGKTEKLRDDFDYSVFSKADKRALEQVRCAGKKVNIITSHSGSSYELTGDGEDRVLNIKNADLFWKASRYLVIVTD